MSIKNFFNKFHYKKHYSLAEKVIFGVLYPVSLIYETISRIRVRLYNIKVMKSEHPEARVISIGNITTGGTGKTPTVLEFAKHLSSKDKSKVAILSRGYGAENKKEINVVKVGRELLASNPSECGDEAFMLAKQLDNIVIITGSKRVKTAKEAITKYNVNTIILDDGFQHLPLQRDLNIALIDSKKLLGNRTQLPTGPLREPLSALKRADAIIMTNKNSTNYSIESIPKFIKDFNKPTFISNYIFEGFVNLNTLNIKRKLNSKNIITFCGIGQPEYFNRQIKSQGYNLLDSVTFSDHHNYTSKDIESINKLAKSNNADKIITTEKDAVKITNYLSEFDLPIFAIKMKMDLDVENILKETNFNV